jgi:hypothetical protein
MGAAGDCQSGEGRIGACLFRVDLSRVASMANLAALFPATLSGDSSTRIAAELQLRKVSDP